MTRPIILATNDAAEFVGVSRSRLRELIVARGFIPAKVGQKNIKFFKKSDLDKIRREERKPGRPPKNKKAKHDNC